MKCTDSIYEFYAILSETVMDPPPPFTSLWGGSFSEDLFLLHFYTKKTLSFQQKLKFTGLHDSPLLADVNPGGKGLLVTSKPIRESNLKNIFIIKNHFGFYVYLLFDYTRMLKTRLSKERRPFFQLSSPLRYPLIAQNSYHCYLPFLYLCLSSLCAVAWEERGVVSTTAKSMDFYTYSMHRFRPLCRVSNLLLCLFVNFANFIECDSEI